MDHAVQKLERDLDHIRNLLDQGTLFSFSPEESQSIRAAASKISFKLAEVESEHLTIGLLGGTGVGKSTLMNALAGTKIASASQRRPHTDHVLVYRHHEAPPIRTTSLKDLPWKEITHKGNAIKQILLCDLPDFDSLIGEHQEQVLRFLKHLDVIVWVTSPEKYADGRFYDFLAGVPKAKQNFLFVLNKVDLLFQGGAGEEGYRQMSLVMKTFQGYVRKSGIDSPVLYAVSSEEGLAMDQASPWNQLPALGRHIFQQRDVKQIQTIKAANLDAEVHRLIEAFKKETLNLKKFHGLLDGFIRELREQNTKWIEAGRQVIAIQTEKEVRPDAVYPFGAARPLLGPGYGLALLFQAFQKGRPADHSPVLDLSKSNLSTEIAAGFKKRMERMEANMRHALLQQGLPTTFQKRVKGILNPTRRFETLRGNLSETIASFAAAPPLPTFRLFRVWQRVVYLVLFILLLFAIGGDAWQRVLMSPGPANILTLLVTGVQNLFSGKGLAALGSYAVLNLILAFRFYARYRKRLRLAVRRLAEEMKKSLIDSWGQETTAVQNELLALESDTRDHLSALSHFERPEKISELKEAGIGLTPEGG